MPSPSLISPSKICSVPIFVCPKRIASSCDNARTFWARSVNRPNIIIISSFSDRSLTLTVRASLSRAFHHVHVDLSDVLHTVVRMPVGLIPLIHLKSFLIYLLYTPHRYLI